ncbi:dolichyl-phosphate-mannose-protein mannosyltransferase [Actinomadura pelletieri DSM 43383]|uniref:Dolichyl-phosphate-mannose-protein mannosyltransferase n=1 Tax=Actinomadura pelletieri DSM 43383 TaxID=1120940 RepID=A0A495QIW2_9ACTN|nr:glycosyltransferase family 39 protein [Actinomadura pelletieri]RKS72102.1 dolichyl-phosphate-mannose-protein mannosyltransferase [Actinomadura pelletieri DSM 43383]
MAQTTSDRPTADQAATGAGRTPRLRRSWRAARTWRIWRTRRVLWLSLLVSAATIGTQWVLMTPPLYFDPYYVWLAAREWPDIPLDRWPFSEVPHQVTRIGLVLPARLVQEILGDGQAAYFVVAAFGGCAFFVGTYLVVRSLFGDVAGVASAAILLVHPFFTMTNPFGHEITWSTGVMLPDMPGAGLFTIGMAGLVVAARRTGRAQTRMLLAAGVCFGSAFLVREFLAFLFLAVPLYLALLRIPWRRNVTVGAPMAAILAVNLVHNQLVWGTPLAGLISAAEHGGQSRDHVTRELAARSFLRAMHDWNPLGLVFTAALALTVVGWAVTRDRRLALVLVWFFTLAVPLTLFSGVLDPNDISLRAWLQRYWFAVLPALLAGGFGSLILLFRMLPSGPVARFRLRTVVVPVLAVALGGTYATAAIRTVPDLPRDTAWSELRGYLAGHRDITLICADRRLAQTLTFYTRDVWGDPVWHGEIRDFPHYLGQVPRNATEGPMLYTRWRGMESQIGGGWRPSTAQGWRLMWRSSDGVLQLWHPPGN